MRWPIDVVRVIFIAESNARESWYCRNKDRKSDALANGGRESYLHSGK